MEDLPENFEQNKKIKKIIFKELILDRLKEALVKFWDIEQIRKLINDTIIKISNNELRNRDVRSYISDGLTNLTNIEKTKNFDDKNINKFIEVSAKDFATASFVISKILLYGKDSLKRSAFPKTLTLAESWIKKAGIELQIKTAMVEETQLSKEPIIYYKLVINDHTAPLKIFRKKNSFRRNIYDLLISYPEGLTYKDILQKLKRPVTFKNKIILRESIKYIKSLLGQKQIGTIESIQMAQNNKKMDAVEN